MTNQEAWQMVYNKYPKTEAERKCLIEWNMMNAVRKAYFERLINESERKENILAENGTAQKAI